MIMSMRLSFLVKGRVKIKGGWRRLGLVDKKCSSFRGGAMDPSSAPLPSLISASFCSLWALLDHSGPVEVSWFCHISFAFLMCLKK